MRVNYEPTLSYAQLSKLSIERVVLTDLKQKPKVKRQFEMAAEVFQRMDPATSQLNSEIIKNVAHEIELLTEAVNAGIANLTAGTVENWILELEKVIEGDHEYMDTIGREIEGDVQGIQTILSKTCKYITYDVVSFLYELQDNIADLDSVRGFLEKCHEIDKLDYYFCIFPDNWYYIWYYNRLAEISQCTYMADAYEYILEIPSRYISHIKTLYDNTTSDPTLIPEHNKCVGTLSQIDKNFINKTNEYTSILRAVFQDPNRTDLMDMAQQLVDLSQNTVLVNYWYIYYHVWDDCRWHEDLMPTESDRVVVGNINTMLTFPSLKDAYNSYKKVVISLGNSMANNMNASMVAMEQYVEGATTKLELATVFKSLLVTECLDDLKLADINLRDHNRKISELLTAMAQQLKSRFEATFDMPIPMLNDRRIATLYISRFALSLGSEKINEIYNKISLDRKAHLSALIDQAFSLVGEPLKVLKEEINYLSGKAANGIVDFKEKLAIYQDVTHMNQEFFM